MVRRQRSRKGFAMQQPFDEGDIDALAELYRLAHYESRRKAKRYLHDVGLTHCTGEQLDAVFDLIARHPGRDQIIEAAETMQAAKMEGQRRRERETGGTVPEWLIGETAHWGRTFIIHLCPGGSQSFVGEVFEDAETAPEGTEDYP